LGARWDTTTTNTGRTKSATDQSQYSK
jgi:hypothetical protein